MAFKPTLGFHSVLPARNKLTDIWFRESSPPASESGILELSLRFLRDRQACLFDKERDSVTKSRTAPPAWPDDKRSEREREAGTGRPYLLLPDFWRHLGAGTS